MKHITLTDAAAILQTGGVGVIATDTIYGIVGKALDQTVVERIYDIKQRTPTKPFIILVSSVDDIHNFGVTITDSMRQSLLAYWPGPYSMILDCPNELFAYLHRGTKSLAFRLPARQDLIDLLKVTGPLVAPSANPEGQTPSQTFDEAAKYFGDTVDFYVEGDVTTKPSTIIKLTNGSEQIIRS